LGTVFHFLNIERDAYVFRRAKVVEKEGRGVVEIEIFIYSQK